MYAGGLPEKPEAQSFAKLLILGSRSFWQQNFIINPYLLVFLWQIHYDMSNVGTFCD